MCSKRRGLFRGAALLMLFSAVVARAQVEFPITITNSSPMLWSSGLLTLSPTLPLGNIPLRGTPGYAAFVFTNQRCFIDGGFANDNNPDQGNATLLAQRLGLQLGTNAWVVPALAPAQSAIVHITVPVNAKLSYIARVTAPGGDPDIWQDFVALHAPGDTSTLEVPLFNAAGQPQYDVAFSYSVYDSSSTSATNGSSSDSTSACGTQGTASECNATNCYVAPHGYTAADGGAFTTASGPAEVPFEATNQTYTFTFLNPAVQGTNRAEDTVLRYRLPPGATYVSSSNSGSHSNGVVSWTLGSVSDSNTAVTRTVTVNLVNAAETTSHYVTAEYNRAGQERPAPYYAVSNAVSTKRRLTVACSWADPQGRYADGLAVGNFSTSVAGLELGVIGPRKGTAASGAITVLNTSTCAPLSTLTLPSGRNVEGLPLAGQLTGNATSAEELLIGEALTAAQSGSLLARQGAVNTGLWTSAPWGMPGYWNMGPAQAELLASSSGQELLLADWDGETALLSPSAGTTVASYNLWTTDGDNPFGHPVIANVDGDAASEVVLFGYTKGLVTVLSAASGSLTKKWQSVPLRASFTNAFAYGSGPAVGNIDGQSRSEIVVLGAGGDVFAFDTVNGTSPKYRFSGGDRYQMTSPVIADVDNSGQASIVAMSTRTGVLRVLKVVGGALQEQWKYTVKPGEGSLFSPALFDVNGDGTQDVVIASRTRVVVLDVRNRRAMASYDQANAAFSPGAVIAHGVTSGTNSGAAELYVPGFTNSTVYRFNLPPTATSTSVWPTFQGNNGRTGAK